MSELIFNKDGFIDSVNDLVPSFQKNKLLSVIDRDDLSEHDIEQIALGFTGEKKESSSIIPTGGSSGAGKSLWGAIKSEVFDYLCTKSKKYSAERKEAGVTIKNVITIIATAVASTFNVAIGVVTGAVTLALLSVLKIGQNAWCSINKPE
ncbi:hypothetical protein [Vibrio cyclitrophicus]|uniref:hypothetical protein n=1 Tax=Vibrio cyclitrophicus TaxID=47951 RepID=UPI0002F2680B|nr:hypothetical protein [Vibrio cyclitrophicus]OBT29237.1 hypothetical protein A9263_04040 [Vibrio cyclitrophicus]OCH56951.1 hypothetical protein A6D96_03355 [Vibrio cyclitrophicus]